MKERPILFSGPMVRAILEGRKTQTRRVMKPQPTLKGSQWVWRDYQWMADKQHPMDVITGGSLAPCPYGKNGDRLWVRETWWHDDDGLFYRADQSEDSPWLEASQHRPSSGSKWGWRPSIHMPRAASRITLGITGVRVERLQRISEADARAEGVTIEGRHSVGYCTGEHLPPSIRAFRDLWDGLNAAPGHGWNANPWVWVVQFRRIDGSEKRQAR